MTRGAWITNWWPVLLVPESCVPHPLSIQLVSKEKHKEKHKKSKKRKRADSPRRLDYISLSS